MKRRRCPNTRGADAVLALAALGLVTAFSGTAFAQDWRLGGQASQSFVFDTNKRLSESGSDPSFGSITSLSGNISRATPRNTTTLTGQAAVARYFTDASLNSEDFGVAVNTKHQFLRSGLDLGAGARRASTLFTEQTDSGNFGENADLTTAFVNSAWRYRVSERDTVNLSGGWTGRFFDGGGFSDSNNLFAAGTWSRQVSLIDSVSFGPRFGYLISRDNETVQTYSALFGWQREVTDRIALSLSAGPRLSVANNSAGSGSGTETSVGVDVNFSISYQLSERTSLTGSVFSGVEPSSEGGVQPRQRIALGLSHRLSQSSTFSLSGSFQHNGDDLNGTGGDRRLFFDVSAALDYRVSQSWTLRGQYGFRAQTTNGSNSFANSNSFAVVIVYAPQSRRIGDLVRR